MDLDRGTLAKIDRKVLSGLGLDESWQMVRVPVSAALWSTWQRYCAAVGVSMGRGIAGLIARELQTAVGDGVEGEVVFAAEPDRQLRTRSEALDARDALLDERERRLRASERLIRARTMPLASPARLKFGRNERCPCGSGFKYKRCHGR